MILGEFAAGLFGKLRKLRIDYDAHAANTTSAHGATNLLTAGAIVKRDSAGKARVETPVSGDPDGTIATKRYVDNAVVSGGGGGVTSITALSPLTGGTIITSGQIGMSASGVTPAQYTYATVTVDSYGRVTAASAGSPVTAVNVSSPLTKTGSASSPTLSIPPASGLVDGYMTVADKLLLSTAASAATPDVLVLRNSSGQASFENPTTNKHAANKQYVDQSRYYGLFVANAASITITANDTYTDIPLQTQSGFTNTGISLVSATQLAGIDDGVYRVTASVSYSEPAGPTPVEVRLAIRKNTIVRGFAAQSFEATGLNRRKNLSVETLVALIAGDRVTVSMTVTGQTITNKVLDLTAVYVVMTRLL